MADQEHTADPEQQTDRRERFCVEYLKDFNGAGAAVRAGYSPRTAKVIACQLMQVPEVKEAIDRGKRELMEQVKVEAFEVVRELRLIAFSDVTAFRVDPATGEVRGPDGCEEATRALSRVRRKVRTTPGGTAVEVELILWSKLEALKLLGRYLGLFGGDEPTPGPAYKVYVNFHPEKDV